MAGDSSEGDLLLVLLLNSNNKSQVAVLCERFSKFPGSWNMTAVNMTHTLVNDNLQQIKYAISN